MRIRISSIFLALFFIQTSFAQLTLKVTQTPINSPTDLSIFVAGNFQGWTPGDPNYELIDNGDGTFEITIMPDAGTLEFKFTRGDWGTVEGNVNGGFLPNRTLDYDGTPTTENLQILSWEDVGGTNSTAADNVQIFDTDFFIPQLNRTRRIWVYLPPDYQTSQKEYPVLYMHDGQNCFNAATSFSGEWEVDESLNELFDQGDYGCIVVAIDNGGQYRTDEYTPFNNPDYGGGQGDLYLEFIIDNLKPVIDATFRTLPEREYTGIMGSSLGGLISHHAIIEYQETFSKGGLFSPSYWFTKTETFAHVENTPKEYPLKGYMVIGSQEGSVHVGNVNEMYNHFLSNGFEDEELNKQIHSDGEHSEWYWRREFPAAYKWLFGDLDLTSVDEITKVDMDIFPNPSDSILNIKGWEVLEKPAVEIVTLRGKTLLEKRPITQNLIEMDAVPKGLYVVKVWSNDRLVEAKKWVIR